MRDKETVETYGKNILGVRDVLPKMIRAFEDNNVKGTFATVGFLFASNKDELIKNIPKNKPQYLDENLSPYLKYLDSVDENEEVDKFNIF